MIMNNNVQRPAVLTSWSPIKKLQWDKKKNVTSFSGGWVVGRIKKLPEMTLQCLGI